MTSLAANSRRKTRRAPDIASLGRLRAGLLTTLPGKLVVGRGTSLIISGWVNDPGCKINRLTVSVRGAEADSTVIAVGVPSRRLGTSLRDAGFIAELRFAPVPRVTQATLILHVELENQAEPGSQARRSIPLGAVTLCPRMPAPPPSHSVPTGDGPLVAVCMATFNPPAELFRRQIESIRAQSHGRWVCLIRDDGSSPASLAAIRQTLGDDPRLIFRQNSKNLGFYRNFSAVMADVPEEADYVALADQDDYWHADKLAALLSEFTPETTLVYSDMNIAEPDGRVVAPTYWTTRDANHSDYLSLLMVNTVTGAASMIRRSLLPYLLPFPEKVGDAYHDHWIAVVATALGRIGYVDRPLYDYVQHGANVVGHNAPDPPTWRGLIYRFLRFWLPHRFVRNLRAYLAHGAWLYRADLLRIRHTATNALLRCGAEAAPDKLAAINRARDLAEGASAALWLALWPFRRWNSWRKTLGVERNLLQAIAWRKWVDWRGPW